MDIGTSHSSLPSTRWPNLSRYEVFLSFRGGDVRGSFINSLYESLADSRIIAFIETGGIEIGEDIMPKILQVIGHTDICIPIFSKDFASSKSCLKEVEKMVECDRTIMPIFYDVSPSVVGEQKESYRQSFRDHEADGVTSTTINNWKKALHSVSRKRGWELEKFQHGQRELINVVVSTVRRLLRKDDLDVKAHLVGMDQPVQEMMKILGVQYEDGQVVGGQMLSGKHVVEISGPPGIGKTTLAMIIYNKIHHLFEGSSFLKDIHTMFEERRLLSLQEDLIGDLQKKRCKLRSSAEGTAFIKYEFRNLRVLIILDDVSEFEQINSLAIDPSWFGPGSKFIIISRRSNLVDKYSQALMTSQRSSVVIGCNDIHFEKYDLKQMNIDHAFELFCSHALRGKPPQEELSSLAWDISLATRGIPFVIGIVGSFLCGKSTKFWEEALDRLTREPFNKEVKRILKRSYESARLDQDMIESEAGSSTVEYAGTKRRKVEVEQVRQNLDMIKLEGEPTYDVFLSSEIDSLVFTSRLYHCLKADGIRVFRDDGSEELPPTVYGSKIYIPILSVGYAHSPRCLDELALMVEHTSRSGGKKEILPVFYHVEWLDKKLEITSLYRGALHMHRQLWGTEEVERWKKALMEAGKVKRWKLSSYGSDSQGALITSIVGELLFKLIMEHNCVFEDLSTGDNPTLSYKTSELEDSQESKIMDKLELEVNDVRIVGIHGRDGIGKTALAKIIYDEISLCFDACSFLAEIEVTAQQPGGIQFLQTKLIFDILKREYEVASAFEGVRFLKEIFRNVKVLIILDNVENESLLKEFVGAKLDWFGSGSRIIVTSKESRVLQGFVTQGLAHTYNVNPMNDNLAFNFFWQYAATRKSDELRPRVEIAIEIVKAAKGLPLLLKVFGSFLNDKELKEWNEFKDLIEKFQEDYQKILSRIYEALDQKQKQMYLDIACFTPDVDRRIASCMWHHYDHPHDEIEVLRHMSLIQMEENKIGMHSMLRCLPAIAQDTNEGKKGTDYLNTEEAGFEILPKTTFLSLGRTNIGGKFADALSKVWWLHWQGCPRGEISIHLEKNENLVILDLSWSKVTESWEGWKRIKLERLKVLNLTGCGDLLITPSFSCCPNLEILIFERCSRLVHLDPSINDLKHLVTLNLKLCSELSMLPAEMGGIDALEELLIDGTSIRELPASVGKLVKLQILSATNCFTLVRVPTSVCELKALSVLALDNARLLELPESIGDLGNLRRLSLKDSRGLGKLPESIGKLEDSLEELDISSTGISNLPDSTENLWRLKVLKMDSCFIREFPLYIGELISLEEVHASWCRSLEGVFPSDILDLYFLRELRLRGTRISSLPSEIQFLPSLQTLDLLHCDILEELPALPPNLSSLDVNPDLKQKMLESSNFSSWWHLLQ